jgi:hypothetical protein
MAAELEVTIEQICKEIIPSCDLPALLALNTAVSKELAARAGGKAKSSKVGMEQPSHLAFNAEWSTFVTKHAQANGWVGGWTYTSGRQDSKVLVDAEASEEVESADGTIAHLYPGGGKFMASHGQRYAKFLKDSNDELWQEFQAEHEMPAAAAKPVKAKKSAEEVAMEKARIAEEKKAAKEAEKAKKDLEKKLAREAEKKAEEAKKASQVGLSTKVKLRTPSQSPEPAAVAPKPMPMKKKAVPVHEIPKVVGECIEIQFDGKKVFLDWRTMMWEVDEKGEIGDYMGLYINGKLVLKPEEDATKEYYAAHPDEAQP